MLAESVKLKVAVRVPVAEGLNRIVAEQLADAARLVPQVLLEIVKSAALVPVIATLLMVIEAAVPLRSDADNDELLEPTATLPNARLVGLTLTVAEVPVPESATV